MRRAVFLDRDGVINCNRADHVKTLEEFVLLPGVLAALHLLTVAGVPIGVVSNQSAVNRGVVSVAAVDAIHRRLICLAEAAGACIEAVLYCPHRPDEACGCRKPKPGLLVRAASELGIDLAASHMVGDALCDIGAAVAVGVQPVLVLTGRGAQQAPLLAAGGLPEVPVFDDLLGAARWLVQRETRLAEQGVRSREQGVRSRE